MAGVFSAYRTDDVRGRLTLAGIFELFLESRPPFLFTAYDGSFTGPSSAPIRLDLRTPRGAAYLATAPGSLGMARAYIAGDLTVSGVHPGDPYPMLQIMSDGVAWRRPTPALIAQAARSLGVGRLVPPAPPAQEALPDWRRVLEGLRHSRHRDADAISHHYDVSNRFYEYVLGPSMTYTCACFPQENASLEEAQTYKHDLVARKLGLRRGHRLLDVGCGWGGMVMHAVREYEVTATGVTLSLEQARWARGEIERQKLTGRAEVRHEDYRDVTQTGFDAISSLGLTEHVGVRNYPGYFSFLHSRLRPGGALLNHCITRPDNRHAPRVRGGFIDRYVFPDGEVTGSGKVAMAVQDAGLEIRHEENLREHYALTCGAWCRNLVTNWDAAVTEAGEAKAKVWGLYLAGSRLGFERNQVQVHQILAVRPHSDGRAEVPLRPDWGC
jgi:cyclopropane-fatty-acyl-phospholipid synthase